jgi:hypothetical protein
MGSTPDQHPLATIERLPVEILEMIHIFALEPNLARASLAIARAVSRESIFNIFILQAFWSNPRYHFFPVRRQNYVLQGCSFSCRYDWYRYLSFDEQRRLQSHVFRCRWFTGRRLQAMIPVIFGWARIPFVRILCLPAKLYASPWDNDKLQLLRTFHDILRKQARWNRSTFVAERDKLENPAFDRKLLLYSIEDAIMQHQRHALFYLLRLLEILDQCDQNHGPTLPGRLYRSAVIHNWEDRTFLWRLIQTSAASLPDEPVVLQWACAASASGDHLGSWILEFHKLRGQTPARLHHRIVDQNLVRLKPLLNG